MEIIKLTTHTHSLTHTRHHASCCPMRASRFIGSICCVYDQTTSPQFSLSLVSCLVTSSSPLSPFPRSSLLLSCFKLPPVKHTACHGPACLSAMLACCWESFCPYWACQPGQVVTWIQLQSRGAISSARRPPAPSEGSLLYLCSRTSSMKHSGVPGETSQDTEPQGNHYSSI